MKRGNRAATKKAFTILEVMMAATVMVMAIATSITTLQKGFSSLDTARNLTIAGQIMQSEFEKMRLKDWTTIDGYDATGTEIPLTIDSSFTVGNSIIASRGFALTRTVNPIATTTGVGMKEITLTVTWQGYIGNTLTRSYSCYYGQNGLYDYFYNSL
jgi:Tfp pilus assembly protein PilV